MDGQAHEHRALVEEVGDFDGAGQADDVVEVGSVLVVLVDEEGNPEGGEIDAGGFGVRAAGDAGDGLGDAAGAGEDAGEEVGRVVFGVGAVAVDGLDVEVGGEGFEGVGVGIDGDEVVVLLDELGCEMASGAPGADDEDAHGGRVAIPRPPPQVEKRPVPGAQRRKGGAFAERD